MESAVEKLLAAALALPDADRLVLIEALVDSVDDSGQLPVDEAWHEVVQRRSAELATGAVTPISWTQMRRRAREDVGGDASCHQTSLGDSIRG